jgi:hypothetical protein
MRYAEGKNRDQINIINKDKNSITLNTFLTKFTINIIIDLTIIKSSKSIPFINLHFRKNYYTYYLTHYLNTKHYQNLTNISHRK